MDSWDALRVLRVPYASPTHSRPFTLRAIPSLLHPPLRYPSMPHSPSSAAKCCCRAPVRVCTSSCRHARALHSPRCGSKVPASSLRFHTPTSFRPPALVRRRPHSSDSIFPLCSCFSVRPHRRFCVGLIVQSCGIAPYAVGRAVIQLAPSCLLYRLHRRARRTSSRPCVRASHCSVCHARTAVSVARHRSRASSVVLSSMS